MNSIATYQYYGYVLPKSFDAVQAIRKPIEKFDASERLMLRITMEFRNADFRAMAEAFDSRLDAPTCRNVVEEVVYDIVDSWGFQLAIGCYVIISHCVHIESGERTNFGPMNEGLRTRIDEFESDLTASEIAAVARNKKGFFLSFAIRDMANSHRYPIKDLPFYSRRATESCMRFLLDINEMDPDLKKNESKGWNQLVEATGITAEEYIEVKKQAADRVRYGSTAEFSAVDATNMARIAWESVHACLVIGRDKFVIREEEIDNAT